MVMAEMVMDRNGSGPKMRRHRQIASDTFILKFASVSEFHRHNTLTVRRSKMEDANFLCLNFYATVRCKKRSPKGTSKE